MKKFAWPKYVNMNLALIVSAVILVLILSWFTWQQINTKNKVTRVVNDYIGLLKIAREKARTAEKINGVPAFSFGVYYDEGAREFVICGDRDGDMMCAPEEKMADKMVVPDNIIVNESYTISFLSKQFTSGVCYGQDCEKLEPETVCAFRLNFDGQAETAVIVDPLSQGIYLK
jgi:hypothetical protein